MTRIPVIITLPAKNYHKMIPNDKSGFYFICCQAKSGALKTGRKYFTKEWRLVIIYIYLRRLFISQMLFMYIQFGSQKKTVSFYSKIWAFI